ncbi:MAG: KpsF/GutQ family sugar-phosphate isomerase [Betaproteobacteria bacterium]
MLKPTKISEKAVLTSAKRVIETEISGLQEVGERIGQELFAAVEILNACAGKIVITGIGKSGHIARKIASTMASTGSPAFFVHPAEAGHGDLGMISALDVVIAISYSGESDELNLILPTVKRMGSKLIAITGYPDSTLGKLADIVLSTKVSREACPLGLAPTASTTATLALGDALSVALFESKGFNENDFAKSHPGGSLGRRLLTTVASIMKTADSFPSVLAEASMREVIIEISKNGLGMTAVMKDSNVLEGVITDGDLRRLLERENDPMSLIAKDVMTRNPKVIEKNALASEALRIFEIKKINHLIVVDDQSLPIGVIGFHELVSAKIL